MPPQQSVEAYRDETRHGFAAKPDHLDRSQIETALFHCCIFDETSRGRIGHVGDGDCETFDRLEDRQRPGGKDARVQLSQTRVAQERRA
jgi:hypothetical protein